MQSTSHISSDAFKLRAIHEFSINNGEEEGLRIQKMEMKVDHADYTNRVRKLSLGLPSNNIPTKVILIVGATGSGKSTLINGMVNYIFKVDFDDGFRFILIDDKNDINKSQAWSQTDWITAYVFNHIQGMPFEYNYVLIDTPGFGDTRGIERDRKMMNQIEMFFKQNYGFDCLDGIGFVAQASAARLNATQRYVYDGLSSIFGNDVMKNIFVMATFADAKTPTVIEALKAANFEYTDIFTFNNSALYVSNTSSKVIKGFSKHRMNEMYWEMGFSSMESFFLELGKILPVSLTLTKEVLHERRQLQMIVVELQNKIRYGLSRISALEEEQNMLNQFSTDAKINKNYTRSIQVPHISKIKVKPGYCVTNCYNCNDTCHWPCYLDPSRDKENCAAMLNGCCVRCKGNCSWEKHSHMLHRYKHSTKTETKTFDDLFVKYNIAEEGMHSKQKLVNAIECEIKQSSKELLDIIKKAQEHVKHLDKIALKPNPLSSVKDYIDILITTEEHNTHSMYLQRIKVLQELRGQVVLLQEVDNHPKADGADLYKYFGSKLSLN